VKDLGYRGRVCLYVDAMSLEREGEHHQEFKNHFQSCMFHCAVAPQAIILVKVQLQLHVVSLQATQEKNFSKFQAVRCSLHPRSCQQTHFTSLIDYPSLCYSVSVLYPECVY